MGLFLGFRRFYNTAGRDYDGFGLVVYNRWSYCLCSEGGGCVGGYEDAVKSSGSGLCLLSGPVKMCDNVHVSGNKKIKNITKKFLRLSEVEKWAYQ